jgi:hypothetical protein
MSEEKIVEELTTVKAGIQMLLATPRKLSQQERLHLEGLSCRFTMLRQMQRNT